LVRCELGGPEPDDPLSGEIGDGGVSSRSGYAAKLLAWLRQTVHGGQGASVEVEAFEARAVRFDQRRIGLHHLCFRARSREDIDELRQLRGVGQSVAAELRRLDIRSDGAAQGGGVFVAALAV
jgi:hypothetical protein